MNDINGIVKLLKSGKRGKLAPDGKSVQLLEQLVYVVQDILILQALEAGITAENARALARVDKALVNRVSKVRPKERAKKV